MIKNCVIRTDCRSPRETTLEELVSKLSDGWVVKFATLIKTGCIEYILEKELEVQSD